nr:hypothetical protein [Tanacetum cinerariifolium]
MTNTRSGMTPAAIKEMINRRVAKALEAYEINRNLGLENGNGNGNGGNGNGGNGNRQGENRNGDGRGDRPAARECTYQYFMKCQPLYFKGTEGVVGLIRWNVIAVEHTRLQDAVHIANNLMDQKLKGYATKNAKNKRRLEVNQRDNHGQQPPFKRQNVGGQNVARAYTAGSNEKIGYVGPCTMKCEKCNKVGHIARDCKNAVVVQTT